MKETDIPLCGYCDQPMYNHWICGICRCLGHANVIAHYDPTICADCEASLVRRGLRHCKQCGFVGLLSDYPSAGRGGLKRRVCKPCHNRSKDAYRAAHRAERRASARRWYHANRERHYQLHKKWRDENRATFNASRKAAYWKNPEKYRAANRQQRAARREHFRLYHRRYRQRLGSAYYQRRRERRAQKLIAILHGRTP